MEQQDQRQNALPGQPALYLASGMMNFVGVIGMVALAYYAKRYLDATLMQLALITVIGNLVEELVRLRVHFQHPI